VDKGVSTGTEMRAPGWHNLPPPKKGGGASKQAGQIPSPVKLMIILVYGVQGDHVCHPFPYHQTVNAQYFKSFLHEHLHYTVSDRYSELD
jgi:hypothetical protein